MTVLAKLTVPSPHSGYASGVNGYAISTSSHCRSCVMGCDAELAAALNLRTGLQSPPEVAHFPLFHSMAGPWTLPGKSLAIFFCLGNIPSSLNYCFLSSQGRANLSFILSRSSSPSLREGPQLRLSFGLGYRYPNSMCEYLCVSKLFIITCPGHPALFLAQR